MKKHPTKLYLKLSLACLLVLLLAAFGCKSGEDSNETTEESDTNTTEETVTFTTDDTAVNTATNTTTTDEANTATTSDINSPVNSAVNTSSSTSSDDEDQTKVLKLGTSLAEIFGTFTNKDKEPYKNLKDLKPYASQKMSGWVDNKISGAAKPASDAPFYGITTRVLSSAVLESSSTSYQLLLTCQREEITEVTSSPKKSYQLLEMNFIKESKEWKLDGAFWKE